jgi:hypothetical protein
VLVERVQLSVVLVLLPLLEGPAIDPHSQLFYCHDVPTSFANVDAVATAAWMMLCLVTSRRFNGDDYWLLLASRTLLARQQQIILGSATYESPTRLHERCW